MNTSHRFAAGAHIMALLSVSDGPDSSTYIAASVNTNPALIRPRLAIAGCARDQTMIADNQNRVTGAPAFAAISNTPGAVRYPTACFVITAIFDSGTAVENQGKAGLPCDR